MDVAIIVANFAIAAGYFFAATRITRLMPVRKVTWVAGALFFMLCAATHIEMNIHYMFFGAESFTDAFTDWHMVLIHVPQAIAIWVFAIGFFRDLQTLLDGTDDTA